MPDMVNIKFKTNVFDRFNVKDESKGVENL